MLRQIEDQIAAINKLDGGKKRKKVAILGAGMAGLTAAHQLRKLGHEVTIFEANSRIGGRAWTKRFNVTPDNPSGDYHELGAMRFPLEHDYTRYYAKVCGLSFRPFINHHDEKDSFYYFKGTISRHHDWDLKLLPELNLTSNELDMIFNGPIPNTPETKHKLLLNLLVHPLETAAKEIEHNEADFKAILGVGPITPKIKKLDQLSLGDFLRKYITSTDALELIGGVTGLEVWWEKAATMILREEIMATVRKKAQNLSSGIEEIIGGTDLLPQRLFELNNDLGVKTLLNHQVFSINKRRSSIQLGIINKEERKLIDFEHVICTLPYSILRQIELSGLSSKKMTAIRNLAYGSSSKVLLHCKERFWELNYDIKGGGSQMDLINRQIYYPSDNIDAVPTTTNEEKSFGNVFVNSVSYTNRTIKNIDKSKLPAVFVGCYNWGQDARRLGALDKEERVNVVKEAVSKIHPEVLEEGMVIDNASIFWDEYAYAAGAFCFMRPGDYTNYYQAAIASEGNLRFAGEHCSLDNGWIQGSIISSLNAVEQIVSL